jgi:hypothetical protein
MVRQAQAVRHVALATTVRSVTHVQLVMTATPVDRAPRATTARPMMTAVPVPFAMTVHLARIARIEPLGTNTPSAMVAPSAKAATLTPRTSSTVPFEPHGMNDVTYAPRVMTARHVTTALPVDRAPRATTVHRARIEPIVRSFPLVTIVLHVMTAIRVMTVVPLAMTGLPETIASRVTTDRHETTVPHAATRISILRATRRRSTSPAKTSYSSVFRRWPLRLMTSMV